LSTPSCIDCTLTMPGCLFCTSSVSCSTCDDTNNFEITASNNCSCANGYALSATNTCVPCSDTLTGCLTCTSQTACINCDTGSNFITDPGNSSQCACNPGFYLSTGICTDCLTTSMIGCTECSSATVCTLCDDSQDFTLIGATCQCISGYYPFETTCLSCTSVTGCITCTDALTCTLCDTTQFF
jgi:proprotein convertase subtilisin/kexin type 5